MENEISKPVWTEAAEIELVYKTKVKASQRPKIEKAEDAYNLLIKIWDMNTIELQEQFKVILLNRMNKVLGIYNASSGGMTGTVADVRLILVAALKAGASYMILSHNHPSSSLKPSRQDEELTSKIKEAAKYLDMKVIDHIIVSQEGYYSFADEGLL